jgi:hypothetical protein
VDVDESRRRRVTATVGALTGTATFTVGAEPRDPATVTLR